MGGDDLRSEVAELRRALRRARWMLAVLLVLVGALLVAHRRDRQRLESLTEHARWLYPYVPKLDRHFDFTIDFHGVTFEGNTATDYSIYATGADEKPDLYFMRDALAALAPKGVYVDVGASRGNHAFFMSAHAGRVVAVEPLPAAVAHMRRTIERNRTTNVEVLPVGFGDENARLPFFQQGGDQMNTGSFVEGFSVDNAAGGVLEVRVGDEALAALALPSVDIIKIDVEGFEPQVLKGLAKTLRAHRPVVLMELLSHDHPGRFETREALEARFPEGYRFLQFGDYEVYSGRYRLEPLDFSAQTRPRPSGRRVRARNVVACPKEKTESLPKTNAAR